MDEHIKWLLETYGHDDQRTSAWHAKRGTMLTASEICKTTKEATPSQRHEIIMSKLTPREQGGISSARALVWGNQFEPIAKNIYSQLFGVKIVDTTCIPHPLHNFLGASPDGVLLSDDESNPKRHHLVEFKCPISRDFDENTGVPPAYYHQMQLQMECAQLNVCEYAEFKFKVVNYTEWHDSDAEYKSAMLVLNTGKVFYRDINETRTMKEWTDSIEASEGICYEDYQVAYWLLTKHRFQTVEKDTEWLSTNLPYFQSTWNEIVNHRENGTVPEHPKAKTVLTL